MSGPWLEAARRIVERKGAEVQLPDGTWSTDWPEDVPEWAEGLDEWEDGLGRTHKAPEGVLLDLFTASMLVQIADALGPANRATFEAMSLERAVDVGWRIVARPPRRRRPKRSA